MTKSDLIIKISDATGLERQEVRRVLSAFMGIVKSAVVAGQSVHMRQFGCFCPKRRARKIARNINQNTAIVVEAHAVPSFKPAQSFLKAVKASVKPFKS